MESLVRQHVTLIATLQPDSTGMSTYKRIVFICTYLFGVKDLEPAFLRCVEGLLKNMLYQPPWDTEPPIRLSLDNLINLCYQYRDNDPALADACKQDLSGYQVDTLLANALGVVLN